MVFKTPAAWFCSLSPEKGTVTEYNKLSDTSMLYMMNGKIYSDPKLTKEIGKFNIHGMFNKFVKQPSANSLVCTMTIGNSEYKFSDMHTHSLADKPTYKAGTVRKIQLNEDGYNTVAATITAITDSKMKIIPNFFKWGK
jgi:hypothetical protein